MTKSEGLLRRVLVVDDSRVVQVALTHILQEQGFVVTVADCSEMAMELFLADPFPVVFSDIVMPGISGLDLLRQIKQLQPETQVVMITGQSSLDNAVMALRLGASDYLKKPFDGPEQIVELARQAFEKIDQLQNTDTLIAQLRQQIEGLEQAKRQFQELSMRDGLTGLFNRRYFQASLSVEFSRAKRHLREFSLIFLDIDHFKTYNDTHGHPEGDKLLTFLGKLLKERVRGSDIPARYGGEEFTVILPETPKSGAVIIAEAIRTMIAETQFPGGESQPLGRVTSSFGVATYPEDGSDPNEILVAADQALYQAKQNGRNTVCVSKSRPGQ